MKLEKEVCMHQNIRQRVRAALRAADVDVYIAVTASNFRYLSGYNSAFIDLSWQMTGTDLIVLPTDETLAPAMIISEYSEGDARLHSDIDDIRTYSMWTENRPYHIVSDARGSILHRPEQYQSQDIFRLVADVLRDRGLNNPTIGSDIALMKHESFEALQRAFPNAEFVDCEDALYKTRQIKHPEEIRRLKQAAYLFDVGVQAVFDELQVGQTTTTLRAVFEEALQDAALNDPDIGAIEKTFFFPHIGNSGTLQLGHGDVVKIDCGAKVDGYWSDGCRYVCFGPALESQRRIHDALSAGFETARAMLRPGARMGDIYTAALDAVRKNGLPAYSRGHFGHSIGMDDKTEEPPFIGPNNTVIEEGMVLCLELPFYPPDLGGFNLEDMFLITKDGADLLTHASRAFQEIQVDPHGSRLLHENKASSALQFLRK